MQIGVYTLKWLKKDKKMEYINPHLNFVKSVSVVKSHLREYRNKELSFLDVGGGSGRKTSKLATGLTYQILEIDEKIKSSNIIHGDICHCPQISDESFDIVFSNSVFEHIKKPWLAAEECIRINKKGGLNIHTTLFSWRYHPTPVDCFRYTHTGLEILFESSGRMEKVMSGYDIKNRRREKGVKPTSLGLLDVVPVDELGAWREHWSVMYIGRKL